MGAVTSTMAAKFAFFPPSPPSYELEEEEEAEDCEKKLRMVMGVSVRSNNNNNNNTNRKKVDVLKLETKRGNRVVAVYFKNPLASLTVLYSHGNAADLGQMYDLFCELSLHLRVNLMGSVHLVKADTIFFFKRNASVDFFFLSIYAGMIIAGMGSQLERYSVLIRFFFSFF